MTRTYLSCLLTAGFLFFTATEAKAERGLFGAGVRFGWDNYEAPLLVYGVVAQEAYGANAKDYGSPKFGGELIIQPHPRIALDLGIDFSLGKHSTTPYSTIAHEGGIDVNVSGAASYFTFGFLLGVKPYIIKPIPGKAAFYARLAGGKYIAKFKNNLGSTLPLTDDEYIVLLNALDIMSGLASPVVIQFSLGGEYVISDACSVGAEILGFRMAFSKGSAPQGASDIWSGDHKLMTMSIYSSLTLAFSFARKNKGAGDEEDEEDEEKKEDDGWGATESSGGWGSSGSKSGGSGAASGGADAGGGWGSSGASGSGGSGAAASGGADASGGWNATPAPAPAPAPATSDGGWGAAPAPAPADGGGGWEAAPAPADGGTVKKKAAVKAKPKAKESSSAAPPPPPPGY